MPYRQRLPVQLTPYQGMPPRIGHNGGPTLDLSWEAWLWRKAHAQAWKPPRRDIALHRLKRAERLGLDYRSYAGVLMNRGTHLGAAIFLLDGLSQDALSAASGRIARLSDCRVLVGVADEATSTPALLATRRCRRADRRQQGAHPRHRQLSFESPAHTRRHVPGRRIVGPSARRRRRRPRALSVGARLFRTRDELTRRMVGATKLPWRRACLMLGTAMRRRRGYPCTTNSSCSVISISSSSR